MKFLTILALVCFVIAETKLVLPLHRNPSIKKQLEKAGKWAEFKERLAKQQHPGSKAAMAVPLYDYFNDFFSHTLSLGTPPQNFIMRPVTSTSDLWVMDKNKCTAQACMGNPSLTSNYNRSLFDSTQSSTYKSMNKLFSSGDCMNATLSSDMLTLPGFAPITQQFGLCFTVNNFMGLHPFDGFLGLAFPKLAVDNVVPMVQNMISAGNFDQPVFSVYFNINNGGAITYGVTTAGSITYGGIDSTNCDSNINYVPVSSQTYWQFTQASFTFGDYTFSLTQQAIVSTGEAIIIVPDNVLQRHILTQLPYWNMSLDDGAQYMVPCSKNATFPKLTYNIGGMNYMVPGDKYIEYIGVNDTCALRIEGSAGQFGGYAVNWVLGTPFLRTYCTHHDVGKVRLGFSMNKAAMG